MHSPADQFLKRAKDAVIIAEYPTYQFIPGELYIVWFCKVLGNWKALISTDVWDGAYWEVTYNGEKKELYVDTYAKKSNQVIKDSDNA